MVTGERTRVTPFASLNFLGGSPTHEFEPRCSSRLTITFLVFSYNRPAVFPPCSFFCLLDSMSTWPSTWGVEARRAHTHTLSLMPKGYSAALAPIWPGSCWLRGKCGGEGDFRLCCAIWRLSEGRGTSGGCGSHLLLNILQECMTNLRAPSRNEAIQAVADIVLGILKATVR